MTSRRHVASQPVPRRESVDLKTRERIAAKLRYLRWEGGFESDAAMAKEMGISRGALNRYLKGERTAGLDVLLACRRKLHVSIDWMVDRDPPREWFDPDFVPPAGYARIPKGANSGAACCRDPCLPRAHPLSKYACSRWGLQRYRAMSSSDP